MGASISAKPFARGARKRAAASPTREGPSARRVALGRPRWRTPDSGGEHETARHEHGDDLSLDRAFVMPTPERQAHLENRDARRNDKTQDQQAQASVGPTRRVWKG